MNDALKKAGKGFVCFVAGIVLLALVLCLPPLRVLPSLAVMGLNNKVQAEKSLDLKHGLSLDFPVGSVSKTQEWYPLMLRFNPGRLFHTYVGADTDLTILYNFGGYDLWKGRSRFFEKGSPYEGAFYGAYILNDPTYLLENGVLGSGQGLQREKLTAIGRFDYTRLVLQGLGVIPEAVPFEQTALNEGVVDQAGFSGWTEITSRIETTSPVHDFKNFRLGYLQYGVPGGDETGSGVDFPPLTLYSRVWVRPFPEKKLTVVLYAMTPDKAFLEEMSAVLIDETDITLE